MSVPGTIVAHSPASTGAYIGSPAIVVMPDGSYVASHDFFGPGTNFDEYAVYRSTDRGSTWTKVAGFIGQWWSSLFLHRGDLYTIGVIGNVMKPILVSRDLGNVPTEGAHGYDAIRLTPNHPETFYFKNL